VRAARAIRQLNPMPFKCIAVEGEPQHFRWMREHFADNDLDPDDHDLYWAAAGACAGITPFAIGDSSTWYGQSICADALPPLDVRAQRALRARGLLGRPPRMTAERSACWVPMVTLWELISGEERVDLLDLDVQGAEHEVLEAAGPLLDRRVRRVHIGTHSREIETALRTLFTRLEWHCLNDYPCHSVTPTPYGEISFKDGVQTWVNPKLGGPAV
jgi:FkbM family methyltransferase